MIDEMKLCCISSELSEIRKKMNRCLSDAGWDEETSNEILVALCEAVTNIMKYGYQEKEGCVDLKWEVQKDKVTILIRDYCPKFDPTLFPEPEFPRKEPGGLGIHFIRANMDEFDYDGSLDEGNLLRLVKYKKNEEIQ